LTRSRSAVIPFATMEVQNGEVQNGRPHPLGALWDGAGVNFALYSAHADSVELLLFRATADAEPEIAAENRAEQAKARRLMAEESDLFAE